MEQIVLDLGIKITLPMFILIITIALLFIYLFIALILPERFI